MPLLNLSTAKQNYFLTGNAEDSPDLESELLEIKSMTDMAIYATYGMENFTDKNENYLGLKAQIKNLIDKLKVIELSLFNEHDIHILSQNNLSTAKGELKMIDVPSEFDETTEYELFIDEVSDLMERHSIKSEDSEAMREHLISTALILNEYKAIKDLVTFDEAVECLQAKFFVPTSTIRTAIRFA